MRERPNEFNPASHGTPDPACPQCEMGAGIAASPHLRRAKDMPVFVSLSDPKVSSLLDPGSPAQASLPKIDPNPKTGSFPSAALLGPIPFRVACFPKEAALAQERLALPAPLPAGPIQGRSLSLSPAGRDRTFRPFLILLAVADRPGRLGLPSRSPIPYDPRSESLKAESSASSLWITGISHITLESPRLPFCSPPPNSTRCPNSLP